MLQLSYVTWIMEIIYSVCLLSQKPQHMQAKTNNLALIAESTGVMVGEEKTKGIQANNKQ